jgi:hypothetical protein
MTSRGNAPLALDSFNGTAKLQFWMCRILECLSAAYTT